MTVHWAFKQLGIDPTTETSDIRRAYAKRLKAMDVDADVDGYARLRNARDVALAHAQGNYVEPAYEEYDEAALDELADEAASQPLSDESVSEVSPSKSPQPTDEYAAAQRRLVQLLFTGEAQLYFFTAEEAREALVCFDFLKTDPRLDQIDIASSASDWFVQILAQSSPRSDPLIRPVVSYFGWKRDQEVGVSSAVAAVIARANALDWRDRLEQRSHRLHRAWKELTRPATENSKRGWVSAKRVGELLREIRTRHPSLEHDLDWYRVSLWEGGGGAWGAASGRLIVFAIILMFQIARFAASDGSSTTDNGASPSMTPVEQVFSPPLTDADSDIGKVLAGMTDTATLKSENPKLYALLRANWLGNKDSGSKLNDFVRANRGSLFLRVERSWGSASYDVLKAKMEADLQIVHQLSMVDCANYFIGPMPSLTQSQADIRFRVDGQRLLEIDPTSPLGSELKGSYTFRVPGPVMTDAMKRAHLDHDQLVKALGRSAPLSATTCNAGIALREAILAQPKNSALTIMRDMEN